MSEEQTNNLPAVAPATSLQGDAAAEKQVIDSWAGVPGSAYYKGIAPTAERSGMSADLVQEHHRALIRGELAGASGPVGVGWEVDRDHPLDASGYVISGAPGAGTMTSYQRQLVDAFMPFAFQGGLGQKKFAEAVGYVLTEAHVSVQGFTDYARARGWSDGHIKACLDFDKALSDFAAANGAGAPKPAAAAAAPAPKVPAAERRAQIEALMYTAGGKPNPNYFGNEALQAEYRELCRPR